MWMWFVFNWILMPSLMKEPTHVQFSSDAIWFMLWFVAVAIVVIVESDRGGDAADDNVVML